MCRFGSIARPRLACSHRRFNRNLEVLDVGRGTLVDDDQIDAEAPQTPVFVGAQHLTQLGDFFNVINA